MDSSTGGVPSSSVPDTPKLPFWEGADLTLLGLDCWRTSPCLVLLRLRALLLLACTIAHTALNLYALFASCPFRSTLDHAVLEPVATYAKPDMQLPAVPHASQIGPRGHAGEQVVCSC